MALPLIFGLITVGVGLKKCLDARGTQSLAVSWSQAANQLVADATQRRDQALTLTNERLTSVGQRKLEVAASHLQRFVRLVEPVRHVQLTGIASGRQLAPTWRTELVQISDVAFEANQLLSGGAMAAGAGALTGIAVYGLTTTFASASTGTALATLAGPVATRATLAALGGGALTAGGLGITGGYWALGLLVAGPALIMGGTLAEAKARQNLAAARTYYADACRVGAEIDQKTSAITGVGEVAAQYVFCLDALEQRANRMLNNLARLIAQAGTDYRAYTPQQRQHFRVAVEFSRAVKSVLDLPLVGQADGSTEVASESLVALRRLSGVDA